MKTTSKKSTQVDETPETVEVPSTATDPSADLTASLRSSRDGIAEIESYVEAIPAYYQSHIPKGKPRGVHSAGSRARCFREATMQQLAYARGWLGKALGAIGNPTPYPQSDNANSNVIEPPDYNKPVPLAPAEPIAALKGARARIANVLDGIVDTKFTPQTSRYIELSRTALESARLSLGEELGILGGH